MMTGPRLRRYNVHSSTSRIITDSFRLCRASTVSYFFRIDFTNLFMELRPFGRFDRYIASGGTLL